MTLNRSKNRHLTLPIDDDWRQRSILPEPAADPAGLPPSGRWEWRIHRAAGGPPPPEQVGSSRLISAAPNGIPAPPAATMRLKFMSGDGSFDVARPAARAVFGGGTQSPAGRHIPNSGANFWRLAAAAPVAVAPGEPSRSSSMVARALSSGRTGRHRCAELKPGLGSTARRRSSARGRSGNLAVWSSAGSIRRCGRSKPSSEFSDGAEDRWPRTQIGAYVGLLAAPVQVVASQLPSAYLGRKNYPGKSQPPTSQTGPSWNDIIILNRASARVRS